MSNVLNGVSRALRATCLIIAVLATIFLFSVVAYSILGRAIFDLTEGGVNLMLFGAIELAQYSLMISIFAAIPAMLGSGLIRVDILSRQFPDWLNFILDRLWLALIAGFAAILTQKFFGEAVTTFSRGDETQDLRIPLWIFYAIAAFECAMLTILSLLSILGAETEVESVSS
ncbi:MAG: TRAP transporter small permease subunit [Boseongicola sp.]|nr:TRAP transporter small permease subunit [Boseongicola sp.]